MKSEYEILHCYSYWQTDWLTKWLFWIIINRNGCNHGTKEHGNQLSIFMAQSATCLNISPIRPWSLHFVLNSVLKHYSLLLLVTFWGQPDNFTSRITAVVFMSAKNFFLSGSGKLSLQICSIICFLATRVSVRNTSRNSASKWELLYCSLISTNVFHALTSWRILFSQSS
jgi:hypothetical protein